MKFKVLLILQTLGQQHQVSGSLSGLLFTPLVPLQRACHFSIEVMCTEDGSSTSLNRCPLAAELDSKVSDSDVPACTDQGIVRPSWYLTSWMKESVLCKEPVGRSPWAAPRVLCLAFPLHLPFFLSAFPALATLGCFSYPTEHFVCLRRHLSWVLTSRLSNVRRDGKLSFTTRFL